MTTEIKIPSMGESITTGILAAWHVKDGDVVSEGDVIYELETDKITSEAQADKSGKISIKVSEGEEVEIGQVVAEIDESFKPEPKKETAPSSEAKPEVTPEPQKAKGTPAPAVPSSAPASHPAVSPAVRRIAAETGVDPTAVPGSGKGGRVTKGDMLSFIESELKSPVSQGPRTTRVKMTPLRRRIAERLVAAQREAAILTTFNEVDMSTIMDIRKKHQDAFVAKYGIKLGFMSFFVKAAVHALKEVPQLNAQIEGNEIIQNHFYDIGVAVGGAKGLVVPVVRDCDQLGLHEIEQSILEYAKRARSGKLAIEEMQGGCFTISNGGVYGSMLSTPILNPPQSGILGMHNIVERPIAVNGQVVIRPMMYLALSYDHRIVDGSEAVTFLLKIKEFVEDPAGLLFKKALL